jgi:hypothetical protein
MPLKKATRNINIGAIYQHYKGKKYKVIALARDTENPELMHVVYQALYDCPTFGPNVIWARPYTMFAENVIIDGKEQERFTLIDTAERSSYAT